MAGGSLTEAERRVLRHIAIHGKAVRWACPNSVYVWMVAGEPRSRPVDSLIRKGFLAVGPDNDTATLTQKGRGILGG